MAADTLEWRFAVPSWWQAAVGLVVLAWGFSAAASVSTARTLTAAEKTTRELAAEVGPWQGEGSERSAQTAGGLDLFLLRVARRMALFAAAYVVLALYFAYAWMRSLLQGKRGRVVVAPDEMEITDWRGCKRQVVWAEIQQASLIGVGDFCKPPRLALRINGRTELFPVWLVAPEELLAEIVTRAGLTELTRTWYQQRYVRPDSAQTAGGGDDAATPATEGE